MSSRPSQNTENKRRRAILDAATDAFFRQGYHDVSLDEIIAKSGGSKGAIYQYFGDKDGLFSATVDDMCIYISERIMKLLPEAPELEDYLYLTGYNYLTGAIIQKTLGGVRAVLGVASKCPKPAQAYYKSGPQKMQLHLAESLRRYQKLDLAEDETLADAAGSFLALCRGPIYIRALTDADYVPTKDEMRKAIRHAVRNFIRTYRPGHNDQPSAAVADYDVNDRPKSLTQEEAVSS